MASAFTSSAISQECHPPLLSNNPSVLSESHCNIVVYDFDGILDPLDQQTNSIEYSVNIGHIDLETGIWEYVPSIDDSNHPLDLIVTLSNGICSQDYNITINITNQSPTITNCPLYTLNRRPNDRYITYTLETTDDECDEFVWFIESYSGTCIPIVTENGGLIINEQVSGNYDLNAGVTDGMDTSYCSINFEFVACLCVDMFSINTASGFLGQPVDIDIFTIFEPFTGFNLLLSYDKEVLQFVKFDDKKEYFTWEYLNYKIEPNNSTNNTMGLIRITGIPTNPYGNYGGNIFTLQFLTTNDYKYGCQFIPINFYWTGCEDNVVYKSHYNNVALSDYVYMTTEFYNNDDISDTTVGYPTIRGAQDREECNLGDEYDVYSRGTIFTNGGVYILCSDSAPSVNGDVNYNGVKYEVSDAILFSKYFLLGQSIFKVNLTEQTNATDINHDGRMLTLSDFQYLLRIITGDAWPYPKQGTKDAYASVNNGIVNINEEMGAALIRVKGNVTPELIDQNMTMSYLYDQTEKITRVLIYSMDANNTFEGDFIDIKGKLESIELVTYYGSEVNCHILPSKTELYQNYPNPFNPITTIGFSLSKQTHVNLTIFNVNGQKIKEFSGNFPAGYNEVVWDASDFSSGIYFYKLQNDNYYFVKKMLLLK